MKAGHALLSLIGLMTGLLSSRAGAAWPDAPWINGAPRPDALVSAVAFVSPLELQFARITSAWKRLEKRYAPNNVNFLIVAMKESAFPFNDKNVFEAVKEEAYALPVFLDLNASYAKLWRAYVSPTINLVLKNGKVTGFDPGNFDPALFEKTLQRVLKENGTSNLPPREFSNDGEAKNCGPSHSYFVGNRYENAWAIRTLNTAGPWQKDDFCIVSPGGTVVSIDLGIERGEFGFIVENLAAAAPARVNVTLEGEKLSPDVRGRDVQEDKNGSTFINVRGLKLYEVIKHATKLKPASQKLILSTDAKGLKIWAAEVAPACQEL